MPSTRGIEVAAIADLAPDRARCFKEYGVATDPSGRISPCIGHST
jgi:hypothetical protein